MNVFDFDNTIYNGDSTADFYFFCLRRHKKILLLLPNLLFNFIKFYVFHIGTKTQFKEKMYAFLKYCDIDTDIESFWDTHISNIKHFYKKIHKDDDLIISASPEFLLKPLEKKLNFTVIASKVSKYNGKTEGENCYYDEKVKRFFEVYPEGKIDSFYSDSYSDTPLAKLAKSAYIVDGEIINKWDFNKTKKIRK